MLSSALEKGRDSSFLLLRLTNCYCGRGPLAAQLDRSLALGAFLYYFDYLLFHFVEQI